MRFKHIVLLVMYMNIRNNIVNYLYDRDYVVSLYDDYLYFYNYKYLNSFGDNEIVVSLANKIFSVEGRGLSIVKMTKNELLIKGNIDVLKVSVKNE